MSCNHWWNGPSCLSQPEGQFPSDVKTTENVSKEERGFRWWKETLLKTQNPSLRKLLLVTAGVLRFLQNASGSPSERNTGLLSAEKLKEAKVYLKGFEVLPKNKKVQQSISISWQWDGLNQSWRKNSQIKPYLGNKISCLFSTPEQIRTLANPGGSWEAVICGNQSSPYAYRVSSESYISIKS